jgi:DNA (cytosine-5)-methyltransferase 1
MEAASVAWHPLGFTPVAFSEIEPFPCAILAARFPNTPNYGSLTEYASWPIEQGSADILVGGTPCQSFSVAGLRKGLTDPRGNLALTFLGLADKLKPRWIIWENVPGVLSSGGGRDFGSFLGALVELGYGFAYRVLDAQYVGGPRAVPQRRRRVFVIACLGDWRAAAEVLSLRESLRGYLETGNKKRKSPAAYAGTCVKDNSQYFDFQAIGQYGNDGSASTLMARDYKDSKDLVVKPMSVPYTSSSFAQYAEGVGTVRASGGDLGGGSETLLAQPAPLMFKIRGGVEANTGEQGGKVGQTAGKGYLGQEDKAFTVATSQDQWLAQSMAVRRLTPEECEKLQGFEPGHSRISWKGKPADQCPDGPRYKACGNSMAVPVMRWIGERIAAYELNNTFSKP